MIVPLWQYEYGPSVNGWVFSSDRPPTVARRTWTTISSPVRGRGLVEPLVGVGGDRKAARHRLAAAVVGAAPARVVLLGLAQHGVVRFEQLEADVDRGAGGGAEEPAHGADSKSGLRPALSGPATCRTCRGRGGRGRCRQTRSVRPARRSTRRSTRPARQEAARCRRARRLLRAGSGPRSIVRLCAISPSLDDRQRRTAPDRQVLGRELVVADLDRDAGTGCARIHAGAVIATAGASEQRHARTRKARRSGA